jgi:hypothetical protein
MHKNLVHGSRARHPIAEGRAGIESSKKKRKSSTEDRADKHTPRLSFGRTGSGTWAAGYTRVFCRDLDPGINCRGGDIPGKLRLPRDGGPR